MMATASHPAVDCSTHVQPRQETRGRRLLSAAFWVPPVPSWTQTAAAASNPSRSRAGARSRDTMEKDRAGSEKPRPPDGTRFAPGRATSERFVKKQKSETPRIFLSAYFVS